LLHITLNQDNKNKSYSHYYCRRRNNQNYCDHENNCWAQ